MGTAAVHVAPSTGMAFAKTLASALSGPYCRARRQ
jgi:hypothetical protein